MPVSKNATVSSVADIAKDGDVKHLTSGGMSLDLMHTATDLLTLDELTVVRKMHQDIGSMVEGLFIEHITIPRIYVGRQIHTIISGKRIYMYVFNDPNAKSGDLHHKWTEQRINKNHVISSQSVDFIASNATPVWRSAEMSFVSMELVEAKMGQILMDGDFDAIKETPKPQIMDNFKNQCDSILARFKQTKTLAIAFEYMMTRPCYNQAETDPILHDRIKQAWEAARVYDQAVPSMGEAAILLRKDIFPFLFDPTVNRYLADDGEDDRTNGVRMFRLADVIKTLRRFERFRDKPKLLKKIKADLTEDQKKQVFVSGNRAFAALTLRFPSLFKHKK